MKLVSNDRWDLPTVERQAMADQASAPRRDEPEVRAEFVWPFLLGDGDVRQVS